MGGRVRVLERAHILVALATWGLPPGDPNRGQPMEVLHACNQPRCLNPAHLVWGSHAENMGGTAASFQAALERCGHSVVQAA